MFKTWLCSAYIKCLKALCLNEASDWLSLMLLSRVLYSTAPLYRSDRLPTHKSLLGTYNWLDWLDRVDLDDTCETFWNIFDI